MGEATSIHPGQAVEDITRSGRFGIVIRRAPYTSDLVVAWQGEAGGGEAMNTKRLRPITLVNGHEQQPLAPGSYTCACGRDFTLRLRSSSTNWPLGNS